MRQKTGKFVVAMLIFMLALTFLSSTVFAAEVKTKDIPIKVSLTGEPPEMNESYEIIMEAEDENSPMPVGSVKGVYKTSIIGADKGVIPEITFPTIGIYSYKIWQEKGDNELGLYDGNIYNLVVQVTNIEEEEGLETTILLYKGNADEKLEDLAFDFTNHYYSEEFEGSEDPGDEEKPEAKPEDKPKEDEKEEAFLDEEFEEDDKDKLPKTGEVLMGSWFGLALIGLGLALRRPKR